MEPKEARLSGARSGDFWVVAASLIAVGAIHFALETAASPDWTTDKAIAASSLAILCGSAAYYGVSKQIRQSTILLLAAGYVEIFAAAGSRGSGVFAVAPVLFLVPFAAAILLGIRAAAVALLLSLAVSALLAAFSAYRLMPVADLGGVGFAAAFWFSMTLSFGVAFYVAASRAANVGAALRAQSTKTGMASDHRTAHSPEQWTEGARIGGFGTTDLAKNLESPAGIDCSLREQGDFIETVLEAISDGVIAADNSGAIRYFNRAARLFHGLEPELDLQTAETQVLKTKFFLTKGGAPVAPADLPLYRVLRGEQPAPIELTLVMPDQSVRIVSASAKALCNSHGEQVGGVVTFHDITDRSAQEEELRWQRNLLELILDTVPVRIWIKDAENNIVKMNNEAAAFFGISREESIGMNFSALTPTAMQTPSKRDLAVLADGVRCHGLISEIEANDGTKNWCRIDKAPFCDPRTGTRYLLVSATDVTSLKVAKDTLALANAELDQFTHAVSHDLQEPLRKLIIFSEFLEKDFEADDRECARADLNAIKSSALRMRQMVKDLLSLARLQENETSLDAVDPAACIEEAIASLHLPGGDRQPQYIFHALPSVLADRTLLTQVYQNLISNAVKFTPRGQTPVIEFTAQENAGKVALGVKDNGIGVPEEHRQRVFDPLVRLHRKEEFDGTGIGLSICAKAVTRMDGRIWIEEGSPHGSHFRFTINAADARRSAA